MSFEGEKTKALWKGALVLTLAAIVTKILSAAYRIPYQNIAGDIGFYVYQQVYPFYGVSLILSLYGFPVAISKLVSEYRAKDEQISIEELIKPIFIRLLFVSVIVSVLLIISAPFLARMMGDEQLTFLLRLTALSFLAVPFLSCLRGYFLGVEEMGPTAVSQVTEQGGRVVAILLLSFLLISFGYGPYGAGIGATIGSVLGAFIGVLVLIIYFLKHKRKYPRETKKSTPSINKDMLKTVMINGFYFSLSSLVLVLFQLVDSLTLLRFLYVYGLEEEVGKAVKGVYDRGQPLIQLGTIVTTAFALTIVPLIARVLAQKETHKAKSYSELSIRLTLFIGLCASIGLAIIIEPVNTMLFMNREGSSVLLVLSLSIFFSSLILTTSAILQGYDVVNIAAKHLVIGLIVKVLINISFVSHYGVMASAIASVVGLALIALLNLIYIYHYQFANHVSKKQLQGLVVTVVSMVLVTIGWKYFFETVVLHTMTRSSEAILALSSVFVAIIVVMLICVKLEIFTKDEVSSIPKLGKIYDKVNKNKT